MNDLRSRLAQPFDVADLEFRVGATTADKTKGLALVYADTRAYQDRLDDVFGPDGWSSAIALHSDRVAIATVRVRFPASDTWVTRQATGEDTDPMSAEARAFKRACSAFGVGRYLYRCPNPWAAVVKRGKNHVFDDTTQAKLRAGFQTWQDSQNNAPQTHTATKTASVTVKAPEAPTATPTDAETGELWQDWQGPQDAYAWAVDSGACNAEQHARNALRKISEDDFGGSLTTVNWQAVAQAFYEDRRRKLNGQVTS